jgi:hypothetical protein
MSSPTPAVAPYVVSYATHPPYLTNEEFLTAGTGVDVSNLVTSGSTMTQEAALTDVIRRASSWVDRLCGNKVLAATLDVVAGEYRVRDGLEVWVPVQFVPVIQVNGISVGRDPSSLTAFTDLSTVRIEDKLVKFCLGSNYCYRRGPILKTYLQLQYVNGWAHSTTGQAQIVGDQQITPVSNLGFVPGLPFTIKDGGDSEDAVVAPSYVVGSAVVPLTAPLRYPHASGVTVSALPPIIKDATINLVKWLVKMRGSKAIVMGSVNGQKVGTPKVQKLEPGGQDDYDAAVLALKDYRRAA